MSLCPRERRCCRSHDAEPQLAARTAVYVRGRKFAPHRPHLVARRAAVLARLEGVQASAGPTSASPTRRSPSSSSTSKKSRATGVRRAGERRVPQSFAQRCSRDSAAILEQPKAAAAAARARHHRTGRPARFPGLAWRRLVGAARARGGGARRRQGGRRPRRRLAALAAACKAAEHMPPPPPPPPPPGAGRWRRVRSRGKVSNVMDFGYFVQLDGVKGRAEGLHVSLIERAAADAGGRGEARQPCYVKVLR